MLGQYSDDEASVDAMTEIKDVLNGEDVQIYVQFCMKDSDTVLFLPEEEFDAIKEDRIDEDTVMKITVSILDRKLEASPIKAENTTP